MEFIFSTGSLYTYGTERCFQFAAEAGFDGIELMVDERWDTRQPARLRELMERFGLPIRTVHSPFGKVPGWPADQPGLIAHAVELAEAIGARNVVHHLPDRIGYLFVTAGDQRFLVPIPIWDRHGEYRQWLINGYPSLQAQTDVALCIENMPARKFLGQRWNPCTWNGYSADTLDDITRFPSLTMDTTHLATWGLDPTEVYARWGQRVRHIHLSNFDGREHRRPEAGHVPLDRLLARLSADGYSDAVCLELHPDTLEAGADDARVVSLLRNSLRLCREWAGQ